MLQEAVCKTRVFFTYRFTQKYNLLGQIRIRIEFGDKKQLRISLIFVALETGFMSLILN